MQVYLFWKKYILSYLRVRLIANYQVKKVPLTNGHPEGQVILILYAVIIICVLCVFLHWVTSHLQRSTAIGTQLVFSVLLFLLGIPKSNVKSSSSEISPKKLCLKRMYLLEFLNSCILQLYTCSVVLLNDFWVMFWYWCTERVDEPWIWVNYARFLWCKLKFSNAMAS